MLREEHRLRVLRRVFGPKRDEVTGKWKPSAGNRFFVHQRIASEQIEVRECLLSFGAESFVFQVAVQKLKDQDI